MRLILFSLLLFTLTPQFSNAQGLTQPRVLNTNMDPELKNILEVITNALVGRIPNVNKESQITIAQDSNVGAGEIRGQYNIKVNSIEQQPLLNAAGEINILIEQTSQVDAMIGVNTTGRVASEELINLLTSINQGVCIGEGTTCVAAPLVNAGEETLPASQRGALVFERFKANLVSYLASFSSAKPVETKKRQTFGGANIPAAQEGAVVQATLPPEVAQRLSVAIQNSFIVSNVEGAAVLTIDMEQVRAVEADFSQVNPALGLIFTFKSVEVKMTDAETTYALKIEQPIPMRVIEVYDAYLSQEQAKSNGLKDLDYLVGKIGVWAVGRCSHVEHQSECVGQLMSTCARDVGAVGLCVTAAAAIQAARDPGGAAADGLASVGQQVEAAGQEAAKNLGDLFNNLIGGGQ